jgi:hypothetical protein
MKAGRVPTTMEEECREILHSVEEALDQEMRQERQQEMCGAPGCTPPDGARIAACLHLQRAALRSVAMQRERAAGKPPLRRPALAVWPRSEKLELR